MHWMMENDVECMVELVNGNQGVVVLARSSDEASGNCLTIFNDVIDCVMEAKEDFCHSTKPQFFLLDSTAEADYFNKPNMFAVHDVERALACQDETDAILKGSDQTEYSKFTCLRKLALWGKIFPIDFTMVLLQIIGVDKDLDELGKSLGAPHHVLQAMKADNSPSNVSGRQRELVRWWMSSSSFPCWYLLVQALEKIGMKVQAKIINQEYGEFVILFQLHN